MKTPVTILFLILSLCINGQTPCSNGKTIQEIQYSNSRFTLSSSSDLFVNKDGNGFNMPLRKDGNEKSLFNSIGFIIGGIDKNGNYKVAAAMEFNNSRKSDFYPGPLDINGQTGYKTCQAFDRVFTVQSTEITEHIKRIENAKLNKEKIDCNLIPDNIKFWPAYGNPYWYLKYDVNLPENAASFFDADDDGLYNPCKGDYPSINERHCYTPWREIQPSISFRIFNDNGWKHNFTSGEKLICQVNATQYHFPSEDESNDVLYFSYEAFNYAVADIIDAYIGLLIDPSLGCSVNDKVAFDTIENTVVVYNGKKNEVTDNFCNEKDNIGYYPYAIAIDYKNNTKSPRVFNYDANGNKTIELPKEGTGKVDTFVYVDASSFTMFDNCKTGLNGDCNFLHNDRNLYNLLRGLKVTGAPYLINNKAVNKMFTGNPIDSKQWSMMSDTTFKDKDISSLMSVGPIFIQPGQRIAFDFSINLIPLKNEVPDMTVVRHHILQSDNTHYYDCLDESGLALEHTNLILTNKGEVGKIGIEIEKMYEVENLVERIEHYDESFEDSLQNDSKYKFEGYILYQVKDRSKRFDADNYKLIMQCDIENEFHRLYNMYPEIYSTDENIENRRWQKKLMVSGNNKGLIHKLDVNKDHFATGSDTRFKDGYTYHFAIQPFNANNWHDADPLNGFGQRQQFWAPYPKVFSHHYSIQQKIDKFKYHCLDGKLSLFNLKKDDEIKITSLDGYSLSRLILDTDYNEKIIQVPSNHTLIIIELTNTKNNINEWYKVICY